MAALIIRSQDRYSGDPSDFRLRLSDRMQGRYRLEHAALTNTVYTIHSGHCKVMFSHNGNVHTVQLADGFYDSGTIAGELQRVMQAATSDTNFSVAYDPQLGKLSILFMQSPTITMLGAESLPNSCMRALGFHRNKTTATDRLDADELLDLAAQSLCYHVLINNETSLINAVTGAHATLALHNTQVNSMGLWEYTQEHFTQAVQFREPTRELHIRIVDSNFDPLPLRGEWSIVLRPTC